MFSFLQIPSLTICGLMLYGFVFCNNICDFGLTKTDNLISKLKRFQQTDKQDRTQETVLGSLQS